MRKRRHFWIARYASAFAGHDWELLRKEARKAAAAGISARELYELTLQGYLLIGFPATIEAFQALDGMVVPGKNKAEPSLVLRVKKGGRTCRRIYGEKYSALMDSLNQKSPELAGWIIEEGYGKVLSRPGASLALRELFNAALLSASGFPKQLFAHLRALVAMGEKPEELAFLVRAASRNLPRSAKGKIGQVSEFLLMHKNSVWEVPVSSL